MLNNNLNKKLSIFENIAFYITNTRQALFYSNKHLLKKIY